MSLIDGNIHVEIGPIGISLSIGILNARALYNLYKGHIPTDFIIPVLQKATEPQLKRIEEMNPHLIEETGGIWRQLCVKRFYEVRTNDQDALAARPDFLGWRHLYQVFIRENSIFLVIEIYRRSLLIRKS